MFQIIQRKLLGLKVTIEYEVPAASGEKDEEGEAEREEYESEGVIEAAWQNDGEIWVAVVPETGYIVTGPLRNCRIEGDDDEEEEPEEAPELSIDGVGPSRRDWNPMDPPP